MWCINFSLWIIITTITCIKILEFYNIYFTLFKILQLLLLNIIDYLRENKSKIRDWNMEKRIDPIPIIFGTSFRDSERIGNRDRWERVA